MSQTLQEWMNEKRIDPTKESYNGFISKIKTESQIERETINLKNLMKAKDALESSIEVSKKNEKITTTIIQSMSHMKNYLQSNNEKISHLVIGNAGERSAMMESNSKLKKVVQRFSLQLEESKRLSNVTETLLSCHHNEFSSKKTLLTKGVETAFVSKNNDSNNINNPSNSEMIKQRYLAIIKGLESQNQAMASLLEYSKGNLPLQLQPQRSSSSGNGDDDEIQKWKDGYSEIVQFSRETLMELRDCEAELIQAYHLIKVKLQQDKRDHHTRNDAVKRKIQSAELALLSCMHETE